MARPQHNVGDVDLWLRHTEGAQRPVWCTTNHLQISFGDADSHLLSHADVFDNLTQIQQIYQIGISNRLPAKKRSEGTKAEASAEAYSQG